MCEMKTCSVVIVPTCFHFFCRKIVAEYEKTIAQMIGGCPAWPAPRSLNYGDSSGDRGSQHAPLRLLLGHDVLKGGTQTSQSMALWLCPRVESLGASWEHLLECPSVLFVPVGNHGVHPSGHII